MELTLIIVFTLLGSLGAIGFAGIMLLFKKRMLSTITFILIPYAIGILLGSAFFSMIPHALKHVSYGLIMPTVFAGIILFFALEKFAVWRHCHEHSCEIHTRAGAMILLGDSVHNFVDGVIIATAFSSSIYLGIVSSIAVIAHEIPQEVGDFAILLDSGYSRFRALLFNALSSIASLPGALITYFLLPFIHRLVPYLLSLSAASFIYIALADLIPGRRATGGIKSMFWELPLIALGGGTIVVLHTILAH